MSYGYGGSNPYDQRDQGGGYGGPVRGGPPGAGFGQGPSPYNRQQNPYAQQESFGGNSYGQAGGSNVEMTSYSNPGQGYGGGDPNAILNDCRDIERGIQDIESSQLDQIKILQQQVLQDTDTSANSYANRQLDGVISETMQQYRALTDRVRRIKGKPDAGSAKNKPHVDRVDRRLKQAINDFQVLESNYRKRTQEQMARQYRIVKPTASEAEVREAVEDTSGSQQLFSQALMQSNRQGQARAVLNEVQDRHRALQKIEQQMVELAQLFQDLDTMVVQQEAAVTQIEQKGEEVVENLGKGNEEIGVAVETARKTRKKKWICLGICVAIVVVIAIIVAIYFTVIKPPSGDNGGNQKRSLLIDALENNLHALPASRVARAIAQPPMGRLLADGDNS